MTPTCTVCRAEAREDVDRALVSGESLRDIAGRFDLSRSALQRHRAHHLQGDLAAAVERRGLTVADLAAGLVEAHGHVQAVVREAAASRGDRRLLLLGVRELRANVETLGRLAGILSHRVELAAAPQPVTVEERREQAASMLAVLAHAGIVRLAPGLDEPGAPDVDKSMEPRRLPDHEEDGDTADGPPVPEPVAPPVDRLAASYPWLREDGAVGDLRGHF